MTHTPTLAVLAGLFLASTTYAQAPRVGEVQRLQVITLSVHVGSTEKETKQVTYTPPPGWYIRSHQVQVTAKYGNASYAVQTVPADWAWSSHATTHESDKARIDLAGKVQNAGLQGRFVHEQDRLLCEPREVHSSHHALVVEGTVRGGGLLRGGGGLDLTVTAELVYVGTEGLGGEVVHHPDRPK